MNKAQWKLFYHKLRLARNINDPKNLQPLYCYENAWFAFKITSLVYGWAEASEEVIRDFCARAQWRMECRPGVREFWRRFFLRHGDTPAMACRRVTTTRHPLARV